DAERGERDERLADAGGRVEQPLELGAARSLDMEGERDAGFLDRAPEGLPHRVAVGRGADVVREGVDLDGSRTVVEDATELGEPVLDPAVDRDERHADQPPTARALELEEPIIVALDAVGAQLRILETARSAAVEDVGP